MPIFKPKSNEYTHKEVNGRKEKFLQKNSYDSFNSSLLGLGNIEMASKPTDAIAAVFDLEGFTNFSKQIEPHLAVPLFLSEFLEWLFEQIKAEMTEAEHDEGAKLYGPLPFFVKFMGDGLLVIWDASDATPVGRRNIVISAHEICISYSKKFLLQIRKKVVAPPPILRCGLARGTVYSVGNGNDYVGSCINMAARLQKIPGLTFAFNRRGFDLESDDTVDFFKNDIKVKKMSVRGIGDDELIAILASEFKSLDKENKKQFKEP
jgi:hypothetical protein